MRKQPTRGIDRRCSTPGQHTRRAKAPTGYAPGDTAAVGGRDTGAAAARTYSPIRPTPSVVAAHPPRPAAPHGSPSRRAGPLRRVPGWIQVRAHDLSLRRLVGAHSRMPLAYQAARKRRWSAVALNAPWVERHRARGSSVRPCALLPRHGGRNGLWSLRWRVRQAAAQMRCRLLHRAGLR